MRPAYNARSGRALARQSTPLVYEEGKHGIGFRVQSGGRNQGSEQIDTLHGSLHAVPGVKTVHFLAGPTDIIVFVDAEDQPGLIEAVSAMRGVAGVASTDTRIMLAV